MVIAKFTKFSCEKHWEKWFHSLQYFLLFRYHQQTHMWEYILVLVLAIGIAWKFLFKKEDKKPTFTPNTIKFDSAPKISLASTKKTKKEKQPGQKGVKVVFGSQTGTAEDFAQTISEEAESYGFFSEVVDLEDFSVVCTFF